MTEDYIKRLQDAERERDEARAELQKTGDDFQSVWDSRDAVIQERETYLQARNRHWFDLSRIASLCGASEDETPTKSVERIVKERDELLKRVETLRELADRSAYEQGVAQRRMTEAQTARDNATFRSRRACQLLIEEVGADGPADVDEVAERAAAEIRDLRDRITDLRALQEESEHAMHLRIRSGYDKTIADCWRAKVAEVERERDEAQAEVAKLRAEGAASYTFRGGYVEDASGDRWWSADFLKKVEAERDEARAEVEVLRGVGCRETKESEPESGPCGACLRCAEERGAKWALERHGNPFASKTLAQYAEEICADERRAK